MTALTKPEIRVQRRRTPLRHTNYLIVAALWPKTSANLGTMLRTCDALGASLAVPPGYRTALRRGNTIGDKVQIHRVEEDPLDWLRSFRPPSRPYHIVGVEIAHGAIPLTDLEPAQGPTVVLLGCESRGIPADALALCDTVVEIPMWGVGNSLNVAVAGSLVAYRLAGAA